MNVKCQQAGNDSLLHIEIIWTPYSQPDLWLVMTIWLGVIDYCPYRPGLVPSDLSLLDSFKKHLLASDMWSKLSPGYRHLAPIFVCCDISLCTKVDVTYVHVWYVPSATQVQCTQWSQNKVLSVRVFVTLLFEIPLYMLQSLYKSVCFVFTSTVKNIHVWSLQHLNIQC
jgi:hypothetical protein